MYRFVHKITDLANRVSNNGFNSREVIMGTGTIIVFLSFFSFSFLSRRLWLSCFAEWQTNSKVGKVDYYSYC